MRTSTRSARWRFLTLPGASALLAASIAWSAPPDEQPQPETASESVAAPSDLPPEAVDLTGKVEVTVQGALRSTSRTAHSASIIVKNTSDEDLQGPIVLIVDQTGIDGLELIQTDGTLSDDRPYVELVNDRGELKAGKSLRAHKLNFKTEEPVTPKVRGEFDLQVRVCRLDKDRAAAEADDEKIEGKKYGWKKLDQVASVQEKWTLRLMNMAKGEVYGTGVGENENGEPVVRVYTQRSGTDDKLPDTIDGVPVEVVPVGSVFSAKRPTNRIIYENGRPKTGGGKEVQGPPPVEATTGEDGTVTPRFSGPGGDPTIRFARPVPIGVSIANADRLFDQEPLCYTGTLGCRCVDSLGNKYILTNMHVGGAFAIEPDGDPIPIGFMTGFPGETIIQPGMLDNFGLCLLDPTDPIQLDTLLNEIDNDRIGVLTDINSVVTTDEATILAGIAPINIMDACVISIDPGSTSFDTPLDGYDAPQEQVFPKPYPHLPVQKYGRTTIQTSGEVTAINVISIVNYDPAGLAFFIHQMEMANLDGLNPLSQAGDSGSLIVTRQPGSKTDRQPVGLLFAGGPTGFVDVTIANPIGPVLAQFGLAVDDGDTDGSTAGISGTMGGALGPGDDIGVIPIGPDQ